MSCIEGENFREKGLKSLVVLPEKNEKNESRNDS